MPLPPVAVLPGQAGRAGGRRGDRRGWPRSTPLRPQGVRSAATVLVMYQQLGANCSGRAGAFEREINRRPRPTRDRQAPHPGPTFDARSATAPPGRPATVRTHRPPATYPDPTPPIRRDPRALRPQGRPMVGGARVDRRRCAAGRGIGTDGPTLLRGDRPGPPQPRDRSERSRSGRERLINQTSRNPFRDPRMEPDNGLETRRAGPQSTEISNSGARPPSPSATR